jgi:hypothetical protein
MDGDAADILLAALEHLVLALVDVDDPEARGLVAVRRRA